GAWARSSSAEAAQGRESPRASSCCNLLRGETGDVVMKGGRGDAARTVDPEGVERAGGDELIELAPGDRERLRGLGDGHEERSHRVSPPSGDGEGDNGTPVIAAARTA